MIPLRFPVKKYTNLSETRLSQLPNYPLWIPWKLIEPHRQQAYRNHQRTLEVLSQEDGLYPGEIIAILEDRKIPNHYSICEATNRLNEIIENNPEAYQYCARCKKRKRLFFEVNNRVWTFINGLSGIDAAEWCIECLLEVLDESTEGAKLKYADILSIAIVGDSFLFSLFNRPLKQGGKELI